MINFFRNKNDGSIISKKELTIMDNWREVYDTTYEPHSEYNPKLDGLGVVEIERNYSQPSLGDDGNDYMDVPLDLLLENIDDKNMWLGCPRLYNDEVYQTILAIRERGDYPYNRDVIDEFIKNHGGSETDHDFLSSVVYTTQNYDGVIQSEIASEKLHKEMVSNGFQKLTSELIVGIADTKRKFMVLLSGTNVLGGEDNMISETKLRLRKNGERGYLWMKPRATRNGNVAKVGQYVKEVK